MLLELMKTLTTVEVSSLNPHLVSPHCSNVPHIIIYAGASFGHVVRTREGRCQSHVLCNVRGRVCASCPVQTPAGDLSLTLITLITLSLVTSLRPNWHLSMKNSHDIHTYDNPGGLRQSRTYSNCNKMLCTINSTDLGIPLYLSCYTKLHKLFSMVSTISYTHIGIMHSRIRITRRAKTVKNKEQSRNSVH